MLSMNALWEVLKQVVSGVLVVAIWCLALMMPAGISAQLDAWGDDLGPEALSLLLVPFFFYYIAANFKRSVTGEKVQIGDFVAKVAIPLILFIGMVITIIAASF
jgi:hypothetical protein